MSSTERLYWLDPYQTAFASRITRQMRHAGQPAVVLDATCFYPTSGGQPHDTGTLNGVRVVEVIEDGDEILHILEQPLDGEMAEGQIDWTRRLDHMQQHAGQHVLSAACARLLGATTTSFHLGATECTIDLDIAGLQPAQAEAAEELANQVTLENRAIRTGQYDKAALTGIALRKPASVAGPVRVVSIDDLDHSGCGGTHPRSTGEIGLIHVDRWERRHGGTRVVFLCGMRAVRDYRRQTRICRELGAQASVSVDDLPGAMERLTLSLEEARRQLSQMRGQWLDTRAGELIDLSQPLGTWRIICQVLDQLDAGEMRYLAQRVCETPGMITILGITDPAPQFCLARSQNVPINMNTILRDLAESFGGRGGGQPHLVQGGGLSPEDLGRMIASAMDVLSEAYQNASQGSGLS